MNECHISLAFKCAVFRDLLAEVRNKNEMQNNVAWDSVTTLKNQEKLNNFIPTSHPLYLQVTQSDCSFDLNSHNKEKKKESPNVHGIQTSSGTLLHKISLICKISLFRWYLDR